MLKVRDLCAGAQGREILKGVDLDVGPGEVHAIMGINGSGKSTLAHLLSGRQGYDLTRGTVEFLGRDLLELDAEARAQLGLFMAFQYPVELPGVNLSYFLRTAVNSIRKARAEEPFGVREFSEFLRRKAGELELDSSLLNRSVNEGFSGGEKKRNEILQMAVLEPRLAILDETDSGLDVDALQIVAAGVNRLRRPDRSIVVITHYQRMLNYVVPDVVHVMIDGRIARSGSSDLALEVESQGYAWIREAAGA